MLTFEDICKARDRVNQETDRKADEPAFERYGVEAKGLFAAAMEYAHSAVTPDRMGGIDQEGAEHREAQEDWAGLSEEEKLDARSHIVVTYLVAESFTRGFQLALAATQEDAFAGAVEAA